MTRNFLIALGLWSLNFTLFPQSVTLTGESPNYFLKVDEIYLDGVRVTQTLPGQISHFEAGDKVLIIQMTGVTIDSAAGFKTYESKIRQSLGSTGKFEILQVDEVNTTGADTIIYFTDNLMNSYQNVEKVQLVKIVEGETVTVKGTLTGKAWDGNVGGIIALLGIDSIKLASNSIIDISGQGFRGGPAPDEIYPEGLCRYGLSSIIRDTLYFRPNELFRSGNKGEGIMTATWPYTKGTGFNFNGGGAGNGLFSGGGGGSNYMAGGDGGQQCASCAGQYSVKGGWGGWSCLEFYMTPELPKAIFGGGGGSGTRKNGSSPSNGGDGGGMIILVTGTIVTGSNVTIKANGAHAWPSTTTGSGAGGGGGGTILVDATEFSGSQLNIQIKGGNGSSTTTPTPGVNGAGGGGSGGVFWHSGPVSPLIALDSLNGNGGVTPGGSNVLYMYQLGLSGSQGVRLKDLIIPLTGFLFNSVRGTDTICESQLPNTLTASQPKGGDGSYTFIWQQSTDSVNWSEATGEDTLRSFEPVSLNQTTYYRRIISSHNPVTFEEIHDTSRVVKVYVHPAIANNSITGKDTICFNSDANIITGNAVTGGNNSYNYIWQSSTDLQQWNNVGNTDDFDPARLTMSTSFRRIVNSAAYCSDTSSHIEIAVLPPVTGNSFEISDTSICENTSRGRIVIDNPGGGDGNYNYQWQFKTSGAWASIPSTTDSLLYTAGILNETTMYRRIVYSGYNNACIDTSDDHAVNIRPRISNNLIEGPVIKYTCYNSPAILMGSEPQNGFGAGTYSYMWEESTDNIDWQETAATGKDLQSDDLTSTRFFRRRVYSTPAYHECMDVSDAVEVRINPLPTGNVFGTSDTICGGSDLYVKFNVSGNGPFNVSMEGENETVKSSTGIAGPTDSILFHPQVTQEFVLVTVEDDSGCFAEVSSFVPVTPGIVYEVPVANAGSDDEICGNTFTLSATKTDASFKGLWTSTDAVFSDSTHENSIVTSGYYGSHIFKWTEANWHCTDDDEVEILFYEQPEVPDAGADQELNFIYNSALQASLPTVGNGTWSVIKGSCDFNDITNPNAVVSELNEETLLRWTVVNGGCPAVSDSVKIIIHPLEIMKAFTPNGDGVNDYFNMGNASSVENINIIIFNRSGQQVFELDDHCITDFSGMGDCSVWDGENQKNIDLPEGTYFYIAKIKVEGKEQEVEFRSFVEIMR